MKWYHVITISLIALLSGANIQAQPNLQTMPGPSFVAVYNLFITTNKTTNLLFPFSIKSVDRGSRDILAQKAKGAENVLQIKAARENFEQTNLSVITADGLLFSFVVDYSKNPANLNISFLTDSTDGGPANFPNQPVQLSGDPMTDKQLLQYTEKVLGLGNSLHGIKTHSYQMSLRVTGIYVKDDRMFFKLRLKNHSGIDYDIDQLRLFVLDQKRAKRTASQELEMRPVYVYGQPSVIKGGTSYSCVIVLPKFTIPNKKYLTLEMAEKNGGRFLRIRIHNRTLMKSLVL